MPCTDLVAAIGMLQTTEKQQRSYWSFDFLPPCGFDALFARWRARSEAAMSSAF